MDEHAARDILAVRAIETCDRDRALWTDADRATASQDAAQYVGANAAGAAFLARRASLVLERLDRRHPALVGTLRALGWPRWLTPAVWLAAFVLGLVVDRVGAAGHINILAPPVLGVLAWNVAVYALLLAGSFLHLRRARPARPGALRRSLAALVLRVPRREPSPAMARILDTFARSWAALAAPLYLARATRLLHVAAALLAAGLIGGLYLRGLAFEYRASWESTFLSPAQVHGVVQAALVPGSLVTGIGVPDVAHIASIRAGSVPGSENAARWLHLYAATLLVVVILPRLLLAAGAGVQERRRERALVPVAEDAHARRLVRAFREGPWRIRVAPYGYTPSPQAADALRRILRRSYGERADIAITAVVPYGSEDELPRAPTDADSPLAIALFNAAATPESATHGAFMRALARPDSGAIALVDETALEARWPREPARLEQRRMAWRSALAGSAHAVVFVTLARPDLAAVEAALLAATEPAA